LLESADWIFRLTDRRIVQVKTKNTSVRKIAVLDVLTNLMFAVEAPKELDFENIEVEVNDELMELAKEAMSKASSKLPEIMRHSGENKQP